VVEKQRKEGEKGNGTLEVEDWQKIQTVLLGSKPRKDGHLASHKLKVYESCYEEGKRVETEGKKKIFFFFLDCFVTKSN